MNKAPNDNKVGGFSFFSMMIVLKKEFSDMFRDRKTLLSSLLLPMIIMPILFTVMSRSADSVLHAGMETATVAFSERASDPDVKNYIWSKLEDSEGIVLSNPSDPLGSLTSEDGVSVVIDVEVGAGDLLAAGEPFEIILVYDDIKSKSSGVASRIMEALSAFNQSEVDRRLSELGIELSSLSPLRLSMSNVGDYAREVGVTGVVEERAGSNNLLLNMIIPMIVPMLIALGGIAAATDLVAGEKERGTFEPLLSTPASRLSILLGKYTAVVSFSILSAVCSSVGYLIAVYVNRDSAMFSVTTSGVEGVAGFSLPLGGLLMTLLILILLGMMFSAVEIMISTYARSFKEAQTYLSFLTLIVMVPAYATMMMQAGDISMGMMAIPLMNAVCAVKMVLAGVIDYAKLGVGIGTLVGYVAICLFLAVKMFDKEAVLFRS